MKLGEMMKFNSHLSQATLIKRSLQFLAQVAMPNRQKLMIRCPNLYLPDNLDILGTKIWFSNPTNFHCLPTWELSEAEGGHLVCINPELLKPLITESISDGIITELSQYTIVYSSNISNTSPQTQVQNMWLEDPHGNKCYVALEQITYGNDQEHGYFPEYLGCSIANLKNLIKVRKEGQRAILLYCVMHTGLTNIKLANKINQEYMVLLRAALQQGIETLAYKVGISYQGIELITKLPIYIPENAIPNQKEI